MKKGLYVRDSKSFYLVCRGKGEERRVSRPESRWFGEPPRYSDRVVKGKLLIPWGLLQVPGGYE